MRNDRSDNIALKVWLKVAAVVLFLVGGSVGFVLIGNAYLQASRQIAHARFEKYAVEFETVKNCLSEYPSGSDFCYRYDKETDKYYLTVGGADAAVPDAVNEALGKIISGKGFPKGFDVIQIKENKILFRSLNYHYYLVWTKGGTPSLTEGNEYIDKINDEWYHVVID